MARRLLFALMISILSLSVFAQTAAEPEAVSPTGAKFYANPDEKGAVAEAEKNLAADPKNIELIIKLGQAQASVWRYRDAIATYTRGLEIAPDNALLYRHRGHRYISTRQFDRAVDDLERGAKLNDKNYDIWYHLGLAYYLKGDFARAAGSRGESYVLRQRPDPELVRDASAAGRAH